MKTKLIIIIYFLIFNCSIHEFQINNESINIENIELKSKISTDFEDITKNKILYNDNSWCGGYYVKNYFEKSKVFDLNSNSQYKLTFSIISEGQRKIPNVLTSALFIFTLGFFPHYFEWECNVNFTFYNVDENKIYFNKEYKILNKGYISWLTIFYFPITLISDAFINDFFILTSYYPQKILYKKFESDFIKEMAKIRFHFAHSINSDRKYVKLHNYKVIAQNGLILRETQDQKSNRILTIPDNSILILLDISNEKDEIDGKRDYWIYTSYNNKYGWVFGGYLKKE